MRLHARRPVAWAATVAIALSLTAAPLVRAQETALSDAFCQLWTPQELEQVLGGPVEAQPSGDSCYWGSTGADGPFLFMSASWDNLSLDQRKASMPGGVDVPVGAATGFYSPDFHNLYLPLAQGVLSIGVSNAAPEVDLQKAAVALGTLALDRAATLPPPPAPITPAPPPSYVPDPELDARVPKTVGGQPISGRSAPALALFANAAPEDIKPLTDALAAMGKTLADASVLLATSADNSVLIQALRVKGVDAAPLVPALVAQIGLNQPVQQAAEEIAGKAVTVVTATGRKQYLYPKDDTVWFVSAEEPGLTEIFTALP